MSARLSILILKINIGMLSIPGEEFFNESTTFLISLRVTSSNSKLELIVLGIYLRNSSFTAKLEASLSPIPQKYSLALLAIVRGS